MEDSDSDSLFYTDFYDKCIFMCHLYVIHMYIHFQANSSPLHKNKRINPKTDSWVMWVNFTHLINIGQNLLPTQRPGHQEDSNSISIKSLQQYVEKGMMNLRYLLGIMNFSLNLLKFLWFQDQVSSFLLYEFKTICSSCLLIFLLFISLAQKHLQQITMASKAAEILNQLNSQIQHSSITPAPNNNLNSNNPIEPTIDSNNNESQPQPLPQLSKGANFQDQLRYEENRQAPQWLTEILQKQIGVLINLNLSENIQSVLRQRQKNTYDAFTKQGNGNAYIKVLHEQSQKKDQLYANVVSNMLSKRENKVEADLSKGNMMIQLDRNLINKKQLEFIVQADLERMIKIKDGELRSKLDILNDKMQKFDLFGQPEDEEKKKMEEEIAKKVIQSMDYNNYSLDSEKTKIAKDYVRYIQQQKKILQRKRMDRMKKFQQAEKERESDLKQADQMRDLAKKQQILQRIEARRKKRDEQQREQLQKQEQVRKLLQEHHKKLPVFRLKEKEFEQKILKPEQKLYEEKLNEIRDYRKSMSLNEIKTHESNYIGKLKLQQKKRQEQFKLILKSRKSEDIIHRYYKGSAHQRIDEITKQQQLRNYSLREASKIKANRMKQYDQVIHKLHKPNVDQDKKNQLIKLIELDMMRKKHVKKIYKQIVNQSTQEVKFEEYYEEITQKDAYKEGNKFLEYSKKHIKRKQKQNNIEKMEQLQAESHSRVKKVKLLQNSHDPSKKEKNVWELRARQLQQFAKSEVVDAKVFEYVKTNIQNLDNKAAEKEQLLKRLNLSMQEHINEKGMLDHFYLSSIKQKMRLLE